MAGGDRFVGGARWPRPSGSRRPVARRVRHGGRLSGYADPCRRRLDSASGRRCAPL